MRIRSQIALLATLAALAAFAAGTDAAAAVRPFLIGGGQVTRAEKTDLDELLDPYVIHETSGNWDLGGGLRVFSASAADEENGERIGIRLRCTYGAGGLPDVRFSGWRSDYSYRHRYEVSSRETFTYRTWSLGTFFSARVLSRGGFYLGPVLQTVKLEAKRSWKGLTDCYLCGPGSDRATVRYGTVEAGVHYRPFRQPLRLEAFWAPARAELSTTQIVRSENYTAKFSSFKHSIGTRVAWEF